MSINTQVNLLQKKLDAWSLSVITVATEMYTFLDNRLAVTTSSEAVAKTNEMVLDLYIGDLIVPKGLPAQYGNFAPWKLALNANFERVSEDLTIIWSTVIRRRNNARTYIESLVKMQDLYEQKVADAGGISLDDVPEEITVFSALNIEQYVISTGNLSRSSLPILEMLYGDSASIDPKKRDSAAALQKLDLPRPESFVTYVHSIHTEFIRYSLAIAAQTDTELQNLLDSLK